MNGSKDRKNDKEPMTQGESKPSKRFSLGALFSSKKRAAGTSSSQTKLAKTASLTNVSSADLNSATSSSNSGTSSLKRSKSLAHAVGRLFKSDKQHHKEDNIPPRLVSSLYLRENAAMSEIPFPRIPSKDIASTSDFVAKTNPPTSRSIDNESLNRVIRHFKIKEQGIESVSGSLKRANLLISSRCVFVHENHLLQGVMAISTKSATFTSSVVSARFQIVLNYSDIVAIIPHSEGTGIKLATQIKCLIFEGYPDRDEFLQILTEEWTKFSKHHLLSKQPKLYDKAAMVPPCAFVDTSNLEPVATTLLKRTTSQREQQKQQKHSSTLLLLKASTIDQCGCHDHYRHKVLQMELPSTPLAIAGVLFGLSETGISYAGTFFNARGGTTIEETRWRFEGDKRTRLVIANVPDAFKPATLMMRIENTQTMLVETADIIVMDAKISLKQTSFGNNYEAHARWCISRIDDISDKSKVVITTETIAVGHTPLPLQTVEEKIVEFTKTNFEAMLEALLIRFRIAAKEEASTDDDALQGVDTIFKRFWFLTIIFIKGLLFVTFQPAIEFVEEKWHYQRNGLLQIFFGISLIISFGLFVRLFYGLTDPLIEIDHETLKNVSNEFVIDFKNCALVNKGGERELFQKLEDLWRDSNTR